MGRSRLGSGGGQEAAAGQAAGGSDTARVTQEIPPSWGRAFGIVVTGH
jgi:hypothetical protein